MSATFKERDDVINFPFWTEGAEVIPPAVEVVYLFYFKEGGDLYLGGVTASAYLICRRASEANFREGGEDDFFMYEDDGLEVVRHGKRAF